MELVEALHNAARQYCIERSSLWHERYAQLQAAGEAAVPTHGGRRGYTREEYDIFPRYQTLAAIQSEVETFLPSNFTSLGEGRTLLALAGETARSIFTKHTDPTAIAADIDERRQFQHFIHTIDEDRLRKQQPLPYKRVLGAGEHKTLYSLLVQKWGNWYGGYTDRNDPGAEVVTLHIAAMDHPESYDCLRRALRTHGIDRIFELRESGDGIEISVESADFTYDGDEGFWSSGDLGWLVYASHELSITFGGRWLIESMKVALPEFDRYIYKGWDQNLYA